MTNSEKVRLAVAHCLRSNDISICEECPYNVGNDYGCRARLRDDIVTLLRAQESKDLELLSRVKSGKVLKSVCKDYVIYNGDWYRKNRWDWPEKAQEPVEPSIGGDADGMHGNWWYTCGWCHEQIDRGDKYCRWCGKAVKWIV